MGSVKTMKKYGLLFLVNLLLLFSVNKYYQNSEEEPQALAYRFTFVCPQIWEEAAAGMEQADSDLGTDTKYVGFKNLDELIKNNTTLNSGDKIYYNNKI